MTSPPLFTLVLATENRGKLKELRAMLRDLPVDLVAVSDIVKDRAPVIEDGLTFEDNARIKANAAVAATAMVSIADDSGLEVDALGGRPGVRSARFAGEGTTDAENNAKLLEALAEVEDDQRRARFRCVIIVSDPFAEGAAREVVAEGRCEGMIAREPRGAGGFGYDPLFVVEGFGRTLAELTDAEKNQVSHRGRAVAAAIPAIRAIVERQRAIAEKL